MSASSAAMRVGPGDAPVLELHRIVKDFPGVRALDGVSFALAASEIHALCGENGAGKSTLIKILCGLFPAGSYDGDVHLRDENIALGCEPTRAGLVDRARVRDRAQRALARVGLDVDPATLVRELGIAQQQMVEIAKAMAKDASILVLDEPTAALGGSDARRLLSLLRELREHGVASILVSHRLDEVFQVADRITVLRDGRSIATSDAVAMPRERAIAQHGDAVGNLEQLFETVRDEQDGRAIVAQAAHDAEQVGYFAQRQG